MAQLAVELVRETGYAADEIEVEWLPQKQFVGDKLLQVARTRVLISLDAPEQNWDADYLGNSNIGVPGHWTARVDELNRLVADNEIAESEPGTHAHFAHRPHIAGSLVEGRAMRGLCGAFFVPYQNPEDLPVCPACAAEYENLSG